MSSLGLVVILIAITIGCCVQGAVGFGVGTVAAPVVALIEPSLLPGFIVILGLVLTAAICVRERTAINFRGAGIAFMGRFLGTVAGVSAVSLLPERWMAIFVGVFVLVAMMLSVIGWRPTPSARNIALAGAASGLFGTAAGIGGPPMSLVWRGDEDPRMRGTMATFFLAGSGVSLLALGAAHQINLQDLVAAALALPALIIGFLLSAWVNSILNEKQIRWVGITVAVLGSIAVISSKLAQ